MQWKPDGEANVWGMHSRSQNGDIMEDSSLGNSGEKIGQDKGMEPQKIQERDWLWGGPSTGLEKPRKQAGLIE